MGDRYFDEKKYSLNGRRNDTQGAKASLNKQDSDPNTSTYLMRMASEINASCKPYQSASPNWMHIDHSSPTANLNSRLKWVENAFREEEMNRRRQQAACEMMRDEDRPARAAVADDVKITLRLIELINKRMAGMKSEIEKLEDELAELEKRLSAK